MTKDEAIAKAATKWWEKCTDEEIAEFQLNEDLLCCPFSIFHKAVETWLNRSVYTHEFARPQNLIAEKKGLRTQQNPIESLVEILTKEK